MKYSFDQYELDTRSAELRCADTEIALTPKTYALLCLLVGNHDRLVSKDEIVEKVWDGRIVSDAAISTAIKSVRRALGDSGQAQKYIRTIHGRGFRFNVQVRVVAPAAAGARAVDRAAEPSDSDTPPAPSGKPTIAIIPFRPLGYSPAFSAIADAVPAELISSLSRLRWLTVVARGSTFRFRGPETDYAAIRASLGANYCLSGVVEIFGDKLTILVDLADTRTKSVIGSERFSSKIDDIHAIRAEIVACTISELELHIPLNEALRARLRAPDSLDAWSIYHVGLQHMFRFNRRDTEIAAGHFERATDLDPTFARAFAARSFTSFQKAFLKNSSDIERDTKDTRLFATKSLELDPLDPFGNFTFGRSFWLESDPDGGIDWLERATKFSPNFAQGFYAHGWADVMACRGDAAHAHLEKAISLSPLDPFLYAMQAARGMAFMVQGDYENAAIWADKGARAPGAHFLIGAIAMVAHKLNSDEDKAKYWARNVRARRSDASLEHFFTAFPFKDASFRNKVSRVLKQSGF